MEGSALSDDRHSWQTTKDEGYAPNYREAGPHYVPFEAWRMLNWNLLTHRGYVTYPHHDAAGLCTFVGVRDGAKIWTLYAPADGPMRRQAWLKHQRTIQSTGYGDFDYLAHTKGFNVLLTENSFL